MCCLVAMLFCCVEFYLSLQRGVTNTAHHSENITCRGVTSTPRHAALSHSLDYISTTEGENVIGLLCTCSRRSWCGRQFLQIIASFYVFTKELLWETVPTDYCFIFSLLLKFGFSFCSP